MCCVFSVGAAYTHVGYSRSVVMLVYHRVDIVLCCIYMNTELEQWNANIAFAQVNLSPLADHKPGNWLFPV